MATDGATADAEDAAMPAGVAAVCLLHLGLGAMALLGGLALFARSPPIGLLTVVIGCILLALGYGLMNLRARAWRRTLGFHGFDAVVGLVLLLGGEIDALVGIGVSLSVIVYLYLQKDRYLSDPE